MSKLWGSEVVVWQMIATAFSFEMPTKGKKYLHVKEVVLSESGVSRKRKKTSRLIGVTSLECRT